MNTQNDPYPELDEEFLNNVYDSLTPDILLTEEYIAKHNQTTSAFEELRSTLSPAQMILLDNYYRFHVEEEALLQYGLLESGIRYGKSLQQNLN